MVGMRYKFQTIGEYNAILGLYNIRCEQTDGRVNGREYHGLVYFATDDNGKTIAFVFRNYSAEVQLYETPELELLPAKRDNNVFADLDALTSDVELYGYYGGIRLLKAAVKKFNEYCHRHGLKLEKKNFTMRYSSTIPNRLGLAGSSAIITAAMRA